MNPLKALHDYGQSPWLDYIRRSLITSGELQRFIKEDGLTCITSKPATPEGVRAIRQLISEGINVNVTLLFAQSVYEQVAEAYLQGLEALAAKGGNVSRVASVASFFISRIDTAVDALIEKKLDATTD